MSAVELSRNDKTRYCIFYVDSSSDTQYLPTGKKGGTGDLYASTPCRPGSIARVKDGTNYILTGDDTWIKYNGATGGSGGGSSVDPGDLSIATEDEVQSMIDDVF